MWSLNMSEYVMKKSITKRSGKEETFQPKKILNSMRNAGVSREIAEIVVKDFKYRVGLTTREVRNFVIGAIKNKEPQAAKQFESHPKKSHTT
jgi:transcriptional regulator NrdR family protein